MKIVLYGATGKSGSRILKELLSRGHQVTAVARDVTKVQPAEGVHPKQDDLSNVGRTAEIIRGSDAVISAYAPPADNTDALVDVTRRQIEAMKKSGAGRLLVVGGAAVLEVAPGVSLIDSGYVPAAYLPIATSHLKALEELKKSFPPGMDYEISYEEPNKQRTTRGSDHQSQSSTDPEEHYIHTTSK